VSARSIEGIEGSGLTKPPDKQMGATARCILFMIAASSGASVGAAVDVEGVLVDAKLALATASPIDSLRKKGGEGACCVLSMLSEVMRLLRPVHARAC
jgi:hypothetical protein